MKLDYEVTHADIPELTPARDQYARMVDEFALAGRPIARVELPDERQAISARNALYGHIKRRALPARVVKRGRMVFIVRSQLEEGMHYGSRS